MTLHRKSFYNQVMYYRILIGFWSLLIPLFAMASGITGFEAASATKFNIEINHFQPNKINNKIQEYIGLNIIMPKGWKTYWRSSGVSGIPPIFDYSKSQNISDFEIAFPVPKIDQESGLNTFVYYDEITIPVLIKRQADNEPAFINIHAQFAVCKEICIPIDRHAQITIPPFTKFIENPKITEALKSVPHSTIPNDDFVNARLDGRNLTLKSNRIGEFIIESSNGFAIDGKIFAGQAHIALPNEFQAPYTITMLGENSFQDVITNINDMDTPNIAYFFVLAFLGGLILNVMACVLPTLAIKLRAISNAGENARKQILAMILGIMAFFMGLAIILTILKAIGLKIGWGLQFQYPVFVLSLLIVIAYFARSMMGDKYRVILPAPLTKLISNLLGYKYNSKFTENFLAGFVSALLATPCSAPLVGTAVSFALGGDLTDIIPILMTMGMGFAMPWFLFLYKPDIPAKIFKSGAWLSWLELLFCFLMAMVVIWLWFILFNLMGYLAIFVGIVGLSAVILPMISKKFQAKFSIFLVLLSLVLTLIIPINHIEKQNKNSNLWQKFSNEIIAEYQNQSMPILVNFTAEWCLTCKLNELRVYDTTEFAQLATKRNWQLIKGDWTHPNNEIKNFLLKYGKYGIPFNIYYSANHEIHILPEIFSLSDLEKLP